MNRGPALLVGGLSHRSWTTVLGGLARPGYSHITEAVSELTAAGAPNRGYLEPLFTGYTLLVLPFGVGVILTVRRWLPGRARVLGRFGASLPIAGSLVSLLLPFFPQDPGGPR